MTLADPIQFTECFAAQKILCERLGVQLSECKSGDGEYSQVILKFKAQNANVTPTINSESTLGEINSQRHHT